jgi:hypothetical protein
MKHRHPPCTNHLKVLRKNCKVRNSSVISCLIDPKYFSQNFKNQVSKQQSDCIIIIIIIIIIICLSVLTV